MTGVGRKETGGFGMAESLKPTFILENGPGDDPHTVARGIVLEYDHPTLGPMKSIAHPIVFNGTARSVEMAPPLHGERTRRILAAVGYDDATIDAMIAHAVVVG